MSSVEAMMLMKGVIYERRVIDKDHKVNMPLVEAAVELQIEEWGPEKITCIKGRDPGDDIPTVIAIACVKILMIRFKVAVASEKELTL